MPSIESKRPWRNKNLRPAQEGTITIPEKLRNLSESSGEFLSRGVFFDVYELNNLDTDKPFVFKDFRSGDVSMSPSEQISLFQHQYYEAQQLQTIVGDDFFPESHWVRSNNFTDDQAHGFYAQPGKTANTILEFIKVQLDRQLADRYGRDDQKKGLAKKMISSLGKKSYPNIKKNLLLVALFKKK